MPKILIISPFSTHPAVEGNRQRVLSIADMLRAAGHEVHLALAPNNKFEDDESPETAAYWGKRLHRLYPFHRWTPGFRARRFAARLLSPVLRRLAHLPPPTPRLPSVDLIHFDWWDVQLMALQRRHRFDIVFAEYIFTSRALDVFPDNVRKIIDTHDIFSDRDQRIQGSRNIGSNWLSTDPLSEGRALARADVALAIQEDEARQLEPLTDAAVVTVGHVIVPVDHERSQEPAVGQRLLFVGSANVLNVDGCVWFIDQVLDRVIAEVPGVRLRVVGGVSKALAKRYGDDPRLDIAGQVDDLDGEYGNADVVINTVLFGTGLAIKSIEALAHGSVLVCTPDGARGIPLDATDPAPCTVAKEPQALADRLVTLLRDPARRARSREAARAFVRHWNRTQSANLAAALRS